MAENKLEVVCSLRTLMQKAHKLGKARLNGNEDEIRKAEEEHEAYKEQCLNCDRIVMS